jgi:hypothetical protein
VRAPNFGIRIKSPCPSLVERVWAFLIPFFL